MNILGEHTVSAHAVVVATHTQSESLKSNRAVRSVLPFITVNFVPRIQTLVVVRSDARWGGVNIATTTTKHLRFVTRTTRRND